MVNKKTGNLCIYYSNTLSQYFNHVPTTPLTLLPPLPTLHTSQLGTRGSAAVDGYVNGYCQTRLCLCSVAFQLQQMLDEFILGSGELIIAVQASELPEIISPCQLC
jgi:hypothetical protein